MDKPVSTCDVTDISGISAGHYTDFDSLCGVTVVLCPVGAVTGVDVRGSAPATRETDLLNPLHMVQKTYGITLSGGSVFGLSAADGVVRWLAGKGAGFPLEKGFVAPIVPAACIYDLGRGALFVPTISAEWGMKACENASSRKLEMGVTGAGTGALSGGIKGGIGVFGYTYPNGIKIAAVMVVNSFGSAINPETGLFWEKPVGLDSELPVVLKPSAREGTDVNGAMKNTTIGVVITNAALTKSQATKVAGLAQNGIARAIRPAHTYFDGDAVFVMATGEVPLPCIPGFFDFPEAAAINKLGEAAAVVTSQAVVSAVLNAESVNGFTAYKDLEIKKTF